MFTSYVTAGLVTCRTYFITSFGSTSKGSQRPYYLVLWFVDQLDTVPSSWKYMVLSAISIVISVSSGFTDRWNAVCLREYYLVLWFVDQLYTAHLLGSIWYCQLSLLLFPYPLVLLIVGILFVLVNIKCLNVLMFN